MEVKKSNNGLKVLVGVLSVLLIAAIGYIVADKFILNNTLENNTTNNIVNSEEGTKEVKDTEEKSNNYIVIDDHDKDIEYKLYWLSTYGGAFSYAVVEYNDSLYVVDMDLPCITEIAKAKFDSNNVYDTVESDDYNKCYIKKMNGKVENLAKITSSIWYSSTDGSKYPIFIYKDGSIESTSKELEDVLKDYKIKDFISEKCNKFDEANHIGCLKGYVEYKVVLLDGTEKTITK